MNQNVADVADVTSLSIRSQAFIDGAYVDAVTSETFDWIVVLAVIARGPVPNAAPLPRVRTRVVAVGLMIVPPE